MSQILTVGAEALDAAEVEAPRALRNSGAIES
jgi:hypothetical protein